ncbi:MAG: heterodisulfide reductase-related iron-sulfur binding cluster, partial [Anaerolineales bacterium]
LGATDLGARYDGTLTYHPSCHLLRGLGEGDAPLQLLANVRGADIVPLSGADECCGFGGLFAVKLAAVSNEMLTRKADNIRKSKAGACVTCDAGCLLNMDGRLAQQQPGPRMLHLAEVLAN